MTTPLNKRAQQSLINHSLAIKFIRGEIAAGRPFPTAKELAAHCNYDDSSAREALHRLAEIGVLTREKIPTRKHRLGFRWVFRLAEESVGSRETDRGVDSGAVTEPVGGMR